MARRIGDKKGKGKSDKGKGAKTRSVPIGDGWRMIKVGSGCGIQGARFTMSDQ